MQIGRYLALSLALFASGCAHAQGNAGSIEKFLITAKPIAAKFLHDNEATNSLIAPSTYKVTLEGIEIWQGTNAPRLRSGMQVELKVNHPDELLRYDQIYLLLDSSGKVLYWERVINVACLPGALVDSSHEDEYFQNPWGRPTYKCRFMKSAAANAAGGQ